MPQLRRTNNGPTANELVAVAEAAGAHLRAAGEGDDKSAALATSSLQEAAAAAMTAGYSLTEIVHAETRGHEEVRAHLRGDFLKRVERTGRQVRQSEREHHTAVVRAMRLGLSTREIAGAAGVTHGTIRAIANRYSGEEPSLQLDRESPPLQTERGGADG